MRLRLALSLAALFVVACKVPGVSTTRGDLRVDPSSHDFGNVVVGSAPQSVVLVLANVGAAPIELETVALSGDTRSSFRLAGTLPTSIAAGTRETVTVEYAPTAEGLDSASLRIDSNANNAPTLLVPVIGRASVNLPDGGADDAGQPDAGRLDAGSPDAGTPDSGIADAGPADSGVPDAGPADSGVPDAGPVDAGLPDAGPRDAGASDGGALFDDAGVCIWQARLLAGDDTQYRPNADGVGSAVAMRFIEDMRVDEVHGELVMRENQGWIRRATLSGQVRTLGSTYVMGSDYCAGFGAIGVDDRGQVWCIAYSGFYVLDEVDAGWVRMAARPTTFGHVDGAFTVAQGDAWSVSYRVDPTDGGWESFVSHWPLDGGPGEVKATLPAYLPRYLVSDAFRSRLVFDTAGPVDTLSFDLSNFSLASVPVPGPRVLAFDRRGVRYQTRGRVGPDGGIDARIPPGFPPLATLVVDDALDVYVTTIQFLPGNKSSSALYKMVGCPP